jgi:hypothetical protein
MLIVTGLALIATGLFLAYQAGNTTIRDAESHTQWEAQQGASRARHPGGRDVFDDWADEDGRQ